MSQGQRPTLLAYLRRLGRSAAEEGSDADLLARFIEQRDEAAFTSLLLRHGPLVWGVCRRVLADEQAAEDAFQATFLVLVRKASSVSKKASVRSWLYGVALRVTVRARQRESLRRLREQAASQPDMRAERPEASWQDVRPILDEEIQRLPEKYRLPIILCYLEGQTNEEAARLLSCPRGTIATRLARGRERLRSRLIRRGLTLSGGALAALLTDNAMSATVPSLLSVQTAKSALRGAASISITTLAEGALHAMFMTKLRSTIAVILSLSVLGGAGAGLFYLHGQQPIPNVEIPPPVKLPEKTTPDKIGPAKPAAALQKMLKERRDRAEQEARVRYEKYRAGAQDASLNLLIASSKRLLKAEMEMNTKTADRLVAHDRHIRLMKEVSDIVKAKFNVGRVSEADLAQVEYERLDAEIALEREKAKKE